MDRIVENDENMICKQRTPKKESRDKAKDTQFDLLIKLPKQIILIIAFSPYLAHTGSLCKELNTLTLPKVIIQ